MIQKPTKSIVNPTPMPKIQPNLANNDFGVIGQTALRNQGKKDIPMVPQVSKLPQKAIQKGNPL